MKKILVAATVFISGLTQCYAQGPKDSYSFAIGVRESPFAISGKFSDQTGFDAIEGFCTLTPDWKKLTLLYEIQFNIHAAGLKPFVGVGGHFMLLNPNWKVKNGYDGSDGAFGIDGIAGLDYKVHGLPLDISVDWQPGGNLYGYKMSYINNFGATLRIAL